MLPIFVNHVVQSTLLVLQFVVYYVFMIVLLIIFRPRESSPYLMIGFSEQDAEERGVTSLATGIAMSDLPPSTNAMVGGGSSGNSNNAVLQASAGRGTGERYGKLPALATTSADMRAYSTAAVAAAAPTIGASLMASEARVAAHQQQQQPGGAGSPPPALPVSGHALEPRGNAPVNASQQRLVATLQRPTPGGCA